MKSEKHWSIYLLVWVGCLFAFFFFVLSPTLQKIDSLGKDKDRLGQEIAVLQKKVADLKKLEERLKELKDLSQALSRRLPKEKDVPDLLVTIEDAAFLSRLELLSLKPEALRSQEGYAEVPFAGSVRTSFRGFLSFLNYLRQSPRLIQVQGFSFREEQKLFRVDFSLSTYLLGSEEKK
ncbi:MAG: type 4a pilus biogenesis protein PilO [Candidatus Caldatribacteriaceae bacterium]